MLFLGVSGLVPISACSKSENAHGKASHPNAWEGGLLGGGGGGGWMGTAGIG